MPKKRTVFAQRKQEDFRQVNAQMAIPKVLRAQPDHLKFHERLQL